MPVHMSSTNARKFYWTHDCGHLGRSMGQWSTRDEAQEDFERHLRGCNERPAE